MRPMVQVHNERPNQTARIPGSTTVTVNCPYCNGTHGHGLPGGLLGSRQSDCMPGGEYELTRRNPNRQSYVSWWQDGELWECDAYDHGPFCRLCCKVDR